MRTFIAGIALLFVVASPASAAPAPAIPIHLTSETEANINPEGDPSCFDVGHSYSFTAQGVVTHAHTIIKATLLSLCAPKIVKVSAVYPKKANVNLALGTGPTMLPPIIGSQSGGKTTTLTICLVAQTENVIWYVTNSSRDQAETQMTGSIIDYDPTDPDYSGCIGA